MLHLTPRQYGELLGFHRTDPDPDLRSRAHILLLLHRNRPWADIQAILACGSRAIDRWQKRLEHEGVAGLAGRRRGRPVRSGAGWVAVVVAWVTRHSPRDFGSLRSRWACATVVLPPRERHDLFASRETARRRLHRGDLVYRRPRPVVGPVDPEYRAKLDALRRLLAGLPPDETAVFQDEVEIHANPRIGRAWMRRGRQDTVRTPGTNRRRHLSGSIHRRTGTMILTEAEPRQGRDSAPFLRHLDDLRRRLRRYRKIHVIRDNAGCHTSLEVAEYAWGWRDRIVLHGLPRYAPGANPIERVWRVRHEEITRNHRCGSLEELLDVVLEWLGHRSPSRVGDAIDKVQQAA